MGEKTFSLGGQSDDKKTMFQPDFPLQYLADKDVIL